MITPSTCVSYSVGYNYIGNENGEPTAEQKDDADKIEADIYNKLFTDPEVLSCAKTFVGSILKRWMPVSLLLVHYHQATSPPGTRCDISTNAFIAAITKISGVQVNKVDNTYISTRHAVNLKQTHFAAEIRAKKDEEEEGN